LHPPSAAPPGVRPRFRWTRLAGCLLPILLASCHWQPAILGDSTNIAPTNLPNLVIRNFHTDFHAYNVRRWQLAADEASFFDLEKIVRVSNITMQTFSDRREVLNRVECEFGVLSNNTRNMLLSNRVVMMASNGTSVRGQYFVWDNANEQFTSPQLVTVTKPDGMRITGWGFKADRRIDTYTFWETTGVIPGSNVRF